MTRAFSSTWRRLPVRLLWALLMIGLTASTAFAGKPTVAILGLEVYDPTGNIDTPSTTVARDLTDRLRDRANSGMSPYQLATGSNKELIDEKLINNCDTEAIACMSTIGSNLGADFLIYGKLEKKSDGYVVTINLLNVQKKKFEKAKTPLMIPFTQKDAPAIAAAAKKAYNDLTGFKETGTLTIRTNADRGTVLVDRVPAGNLVSGTLTIEKPEGPYSIAIEADGFQRNEDIKVSVRSGETTTQTITLIEAGKTVPNELQHSVTGTTSESKMNIWKPVFGVVLVAGLASGGYWAYSYMKERDAADAAGGEIRAYNMDPANTVKLKTDPGPSDCGNTDFNAAGPSFKKACDHRNGTKYGIIGASVSVVALAISGVLAFRGGSETEQRPATATGPRRSKKRQFSVTPVVSTDGGGATFQLDW